MLEFFKFRTNFKNSILKLQPFFFLVLISLLLFLACSENPFTGRRTMAFVNNSHLFPISFQQFEQFLSGQTVVYETPEAEMLERVGNRLKEAAGKLLDTAGFSDHMEDYQWEFRLIASDSVNAFAMPGGKIAFYTGILPVTKNEAGLATVMGHEIAHVLLNHGQQRQSAGILQSLGAVALGVLVSDQPALTQELAMIAYGAGSQILGTLPFSRKHEMEADHYGLLLMAIAGYNPEEAVFFWDRMAALEGSNTPEFLSTHPMSRSRASNLQRLVPEAKSAAEEFGVYF